MMVNETKAKTRVRALRGVAKEKWGVNGVCMTWFSLSSSGPQLAPRSARRLAQGLRPLDLAKSYGPHLHLIYHHSTYPLVLMFCPGNAPIELPAEEARSSFAGYVLPASQSPYPIIVYSVAN